MARRVFLHIGAPKTGTTALQGRLQRNVGRLGRHGVLVPRSPQARRPGALTFLAALDLTGARLGQDPLDIAGSWDALVEQVTVSEGTVVASHEAFVRCDEQAVQRVVTELGSGAELHVVYTARDLGRQLVSGWLEGLKNATTHDLATHMELARTGRLPLKPSFDVPVVLGRWLAHLPAEQVHLMTVPPRGGDRSLLWRRFADLVGIDDAWVPKTPASTNESVGIPEAQVLLALNRLLDGSNRRGGPHQRIVRSTVVGHGLVGRDSPPVDVPPGDRDWLAAEVEQWISWVGEVGVDVVGDLEELRPASVDPATWIDPDVAHPGVVDATLAAIRAVVVEATSDAPARQDDDEASDQADDEADDDAVGGDG